MNIYGSSFRSVLLTLLTLQSHSGLQIVHLHLQALQSQVILMWLAPVGQQDYDDDNEEQPSSSCDAEDGREGEQVVRPNVNLSWRDVESSNLDLVMIVTLIVIIKAKATTWFTNVVDNKQHKTKNGLKRLTINSIKFWKKGSLEPLNFSFHSSFLVVCNSVCQ